MAHHWNTPALGEKREGAECLLAGDIGTLNTAALGLQLVRAAVPILAVHFGLDALADAAFGETGHV